jgi:hypothetical protein
MRAFAHASLGRAALALSVSALVLTSLDGSVTPSAAAFESADSGPTVGVSVAMAKSVFSRRRGIFCFGDPRYGTGGFAGDTTSNRWIRQIPYGHRDRVRFDDSVRVMQSVGCHTIKAELRSGDLDTKGGKTNLRAQTYRTPSQVLYDTMRTNRAQTNWYGFAFSTNAGYVPQSSPGSPNWNVVFSWHSTVEGGGNPISLVIATKRVSTVACNTSTRYLPWARGKPHLMLEVNGGDPARWPTGGATCLHFPGPVFVPGHLYRLQEKVTWSDNYQGAIEWWVDGIKYADVTGVCTLRLGANVYPLFENYRPFATTFPTADIFYGGLVRGRTRAAVKVS